MSEITESNQLKYLNKLPSICLVSSILKPLANLSTKDSIRTLPIKLSNKPSKKTKDHSMIDSTPRSKLGTKSYLMHNLRAISNFMRDSIRVVDSEVPSYQVDRNRGLPLLEHSLRNLRFLYLMRPLPPWMRTHRRSCSRPWIEPWKDVHQL